LENIEGLLHTYDGILYSNEGLWLALEARARCFVKTQRMSSILSILLFVTVLFNPTTLVAPAFVNSTSSSTNHGINLVVEILDISLVTKKITEEAVISDIEL
jgi:hypothetical protein